MQTQRRKFTLLQTRKYQDAYAHIFQRLHYRHELARRNTDVYNAGKILPGNLGLPDERFRTFIQNNRCLTDDIIKAVEGSKGKTKHFRRERLKEYLKEHKIVPLTWDGIDKRPFFPRELFCKTQSWYHHCFAVFNALMRFEAYALGHLNMGQPVMFPVTLLRVELENNDEANINLDLTGYKAPMFLDFSALKESFDYYCDAFTLHLKSHVKNDDPVQLPTEKGAARFDEEFYDKHLEVLDVKRPWETGRRENAILKFYAKEKKKVFESLTLNANYKDASDWFLQKYKLAKPHIDKYKEII